MPKQNYDAADLECFEVLSDALEKHGNFIRDQYVRPNNRSDLLMRTEQAFSDYQSAVIWLGSEFIDDVSAKRARTIFNTMLSKFLIFARSAEKIFDEEENDSHLVKQKKIN